MIVAEISNFDYFIIVYFSLILIVLSYFYFVKPDLSNSWLIKIIIVFFPKDSKDNKLNKKPFPLKMEALKRDALDAKETNDLIKHQRISLQLRWLHCLYSYLLDEEIKDLHRANHNYGALISSQNDKKVTDQARNQIYKRVKEIDLIPPREFDIENTIHYNYCLEIASAFERTVRRYELDNDSIDKYGLKSLDSYLKENLTYPKEQTFQALFILSSYHNSSKNNRDFVDGAYFEELSLKLEYFK